MSDTDDGSWGGTGSGSSLPDETTGWDTGNKAQGWNYCHFGACQSDDALKEQCE
jgi:hypothetical protein